MYSNNNTIVKNVYQQIILLHKLGLSKKEKINYKKRKFYTDEQVVWDNNNLVRATGLLGTETKE